MVGLQYVGPQKSWTGLKATKQQWRTNAGPSAWQVQGKTVQVQDKKNTVFVFKVTDAHVVNK